MRGGKEGLYLGCPGHKMGTLVADRRTDRRSAERGDHCAVQSQQVTRGPALTTAKTGQRAVRWARGAGGRGVGVGGGVTFRFIRMSGVHLSSKVLPRLTVTDRMVD